MNNEFWIKRWNDGKIGFNQESVNKNLLNYFATLNLKPKQRVFVPLCGKTIDMPFFVEQGHPVIGVECAETAIGDFFKEQNCLPQVDELPSFSRYRTQDIEILGGDFFHLKKQHLQNVGLVYDRASLIAFPKDMRKKYADHLTALLEPGTRIFLMTVVYDQNEMSGPPFSVSRDEIHSLFSDAFTIRHLEIRKVLEQNKKFEDRGLTWLDEDIYVLKKNS